MSHLVEFGSLPIVDVGLMKEVCKKLGYEFVENANKVRYYSGTTVVPNAHVIRVPGSEYDIALVPESKGSYRIVYDNWGSNGAKLTEAVQKIVPEYMERYIKKTLRKKGVRANVKVQKHKTESGVQYQYTIQL